MLLLRSRGRRGILITTDICSTAIAINVDAWCITGRDYYTQSYHADEKEENSYLPG